MPFSFRNRGNASSSVILTMAGGAIVSLIVILAILAPVIATHDPREINLDDRKSPPFWLDGSTVSHALGTDHLGRDIWSRLVNGARNSLLVGLGALALGGAIGISLGIVFAYFRPPWDNVYDFESSFPVWLLLQAAWLFACILVTVSIMASIGSGMGNLIVAAGLATCLRYIKVIRGRVLSLMAASSVGRSDKSRISDYTVAVRQFLPGIMAVIPSLLISQMAFLMALEFFVSFLGVGIPPPTANLGGMVSDSRGYIFSYAWWMSVIPLTFAVLVVAGLWMLGTGLYYRTLLPPQEKP